MEFGRLKNFIDGQWEESESERILQVKNPALDTAIAEVPMSTREDVSKAVQAAKAAFPEWRSTPPVSRARYILRLIELLEFMDSHGPVGSVPGLNEKSKL